MSSKTQSSASSTSTKSKEIKIITRQVFTLADIEKDLRKIKLLYIISLLGDVSEKALEHLLYEMKSREYDLGYNFVLVAKTPTSKDLFNDLLALKYTGLVETSASRKVALSSLGKEFLEKNLSKIDEYEREVVRKLVEELRVKIRPIDAEVEVRFSSTRRRSRVTRSL